MADRVMHVDFVADVVCPWCYIGWRNLHAAFAQRPELQFDVLWRPFLLDPKAPASTDRSLYYQQRFGDMEKFKENEAIVLQAAAEAGVTMNMGAQKIRPNTIDAHRVIVWSFGEGRGVEAADRMFDAYFVQGADLSNLDTLAAIGGELGLDRGMVRETLRGDADRDIVLNSHNSAIEMGVAGVPAMIFDSKTAAMGARPPEELLEQIDKALA